MLHLLAFDDRITTSEKWPFSKAEMRAEFMAAGLTDDVGERLPLSYPILHLLVGSDQYQYTLVDFHPPIEDLRLTETQQARVVTEVKREGGVISTSIAAVVKPAIS